MGIVDNLKEAAKLARDIGNMDLYRQILDLHGEALELGQQNMTLNARVVELEENLRIKESLQ